MKYCKCIYEPRGEEGLEGFNFNQIYKFMETKDGLISICHDDNYFETCSKKDFLKYFKETSHSDYEKQKIKNRVLDEFMKIGSTTISQAVESLFDQGSVNLNIETERNVNLICSSIHEMLGCKYGYGKGQKTEFKNDVKNLKKFIIF